MMERARIVGWPRWLGLALVSMLMTGCTAEPDRPADTKAIVAIGIDLPFLGSPLVMSEDTWKAMNLYLERIGGNAGPYRVELIQYDNAPPPGSSWDDTECVRNANNHVANRREVAVIGTYFSHCSKVQLPILNRAPDGPMLMISHTDRNPGLTKTWDAGEPARYFPSGKRSYGRIIATDDLQGPAAARFAAKDLGVSRCFVLNDGETYGASVAKAFADEAVSQGIQIVGEARWRRDAASYRAIFDQAKAARADCVYFGGLYDNNGRQLTVDKVAVLGDNSVVRFLAPDGFSGYPEFLNLPAAAGAYLTYAGLPIESLAAAGVPAQFLADYRARYGTDLLSPLALYGVQALQVILAAIETSDGTRRGVRDQVFEGGGITIAADRALLGKTISIDPSTGDVGARDISVVLVREGKETFVRALSV